jgi:hypothetical protein
MEEQEAEASDAIGKWQERCTELEKQKDDLSKSLEATLNSSHEALDGNELLASERHGAEEALIAEKARANDLQGEFLKENESSLLFYSAEVLITCY